MRLTRTGKLMIVSTGMADAEEIQEAIDTARGAGCEQLAILHCVSGYPAPPDDYNLRPIPDMIERFGLVTGLSDHTLDNTTAITSIALGASLIEKHFTLDRNGGGPDDSFSLEPADLAALCRDAKTAWQALGQVDYGRKSRALITTPPIPSFRQDAGIQFHGWQASVLAQSLTSWYWLPASCQDDDWTG